MDKIPSHLFIQFLIQNLCIKSPLGRKISRTSQLNNLSYCYHTETQRNDRDFFSFLSRPFILTLLTQPLSTLSLTCCLGRWHEGLSWSGNKRQTVFWKDRKKKFRSSSSSFSFSCASYHIISFYMTIHNFHFVPILSITMENMYQTKKRGLSIYFSSQAGGIQFKCNKLYFFVVKFKDLYDMPITFPPVFNIHGHF